MNIEEALVFFNELKTETDEKSEIQVYNKFISILNDLENKRLNDAQLISLEKELETFNIDVHPKSRKKHFKQKLNQFIKFLQKNFSLISEGYFTAIGIGMGTSFGVAFGAAFNNVSYGLLAGMFIGLIIGAVMDSKAKRKGKVLKNKLK